MTQEVSAPAVFALRLRTQHLLKRLPRHSIVAASFGGLQDSAPRSAVTSLHARTHEVEPNDWDHPDLVQVWGPREAVYVVPKADRAVFTLGRLPRAPDAQVKLERILDRARRVVGAGPHRIRDIANVLGRDHALRLRWASPSGCIDIRWDTTDTIVRLIAPAAIDPEPARQELARRFLHWHGPASSDDFAKWAGIEAADSRTTFRAIDGELRTVIWRGKKAAILARDADLLEPVAVSGARLLPANDPYSWPHRGLLVHDPKLRRRLSLPGFSAILIHGQIAGSCTRRGPAFGLQLEPSVSASMRSEIEAEAMSMPLAGAPSSRTVTWTDGQ
ncbi:MAG: DNA glycosylase AlkZ-like family protein [Mycobacteriales bacterium]